MLNLLLRAVLLEHCEAIRLRVKAKWDNMSEIQGQEDIETKLYPTIGNMVVAQIEASGDAAWIKEYGSGHLLDESSPYFEAYKMSDRWNPERETEGNEFIARSKGTTVHRPDGSTYQSSGNAYRHVYKKATQNGLHLEHDLNRSGNNPGYKAFQPTHVIRDEVLFELPLLLMHLNKTVEDYCKTQLAIAWG